MYLIVEASVEKNKKYLVTREKKFFSNSYWKIDINEIERLWYGSKFKLWKKEYIILKPTLADYIMYWLKRQTQIIYPTDCIQIANLLGLQQNDLVFESWIWSWALSLIMLNFGVNLYSFERRQEFIDLAKYNISKWEKFCWKNYSHKILNFDIVEDNISKDFLNFFDKGVLDIRYPEKAKNNILRMLKEWGILIVWVPTANQVIEVIKSYQEDFFVDEIVQIKQNQWIRLAERFRPEDWQPGERWFIIKLIKLKK